MIYISGRKSIALLALTLTIASAQSYACRCVNPPTPKAAYEQADLVLLGEATTVEGDPYAKGGAMVHVDITKAWKQAVPKAIKVSTSTSCAYDFKAGERYLLYLRKAEGRDCYIARACQGSARESDADAALQWLRDHARPSSERTKAQEGGS